MNKFLQRRLLDVVRLVAGAYARFSGTLVPGKQTIFFANHSSHIDTLAILAALPEAVRDHVRPVAARDYWDTSSLKRFIATDVLDVVFVERNRESGTDPLEPVRAALRTGSSIIIFPEGKRADIPEMAPFKSGLYWLSQEFPSADLVPVHLSNLGRVMPKGKLLPIPLMCTASFGLPLERIANEEKTQFLERARASVSSLQG